MEIIELDESSINNDDNHNDTSSNDDGCSNDDSNSDSVEDECFVDVLKSVKGRTRTPTASNLFCKEIWNGLSIIEKAKFKQRAERLRHETMVPNSEYAHSDTSSLVSNVWNNTYMINEELKARSGYLLAGKVKWVQSTFEEKDRFRKCAKRLKMLDAADYPPNGYCKKLCSIKLPDIYNQERVLQRELEGIISRCWKRL